MVRPRSFAFLACIVIFIAFNAFAHRPYDRPVGTFKRPDGTEVAIVRHYIDGIFFADPVSVQFRLSDGTNLAQTTYTSDAVVRIARSGVEVYLFSNTWVPVAGRVHWFDGHELKDITSEKRSISPFVHLAGHWTAYCVVLCLIAFFSAVFTALRAVPNRGWPMMLRLTGAGVFGFAGLLCAYDILVFEPVSPLVLLITLLVIVRPFAAIRRRSLAAPLENRS